MASNQVEKFRTARDAYENASKSGADKKNIDALKAAMDAAKAACPDGSTSAGIFG